MKQRPKNFLGEDKIDQNGEIFDYIRELHQYLWKFVYIYYPGAGGSLDEWLDVTLNNVKSGKLKQVSP